MDINCWYQDQIRSQNKSDDLKFKICVSFFFQYIYFVLIWTCYDAFNVILLRRQNVACGDFKSGGVFKFIEKVYHIKATACI